MSEAPNSGVDSSAHIGSDAPVDPPNPRPTGTPDLTDSPTDPDRVSEIHTPGAAIFLTEVQEIRKGIARVQATNMALIYIGSLGVCLLALYLVKSSPKTVEVAGDSAE